MGNCSVNFSRDKTAPVAPPPTPTKPNLRIEIPESPIKREITVQNFQSAGVSIAQTNLAN